MYFIMLPVLKNDIQYNKIYKKLVCLFVVFFHQIFNNKKLLVEQRCRNVISWKVKEKNKNTAPLDDDGAIVHCSMANSVLV